MQFNKSICLAAIVMISACGQKSKDDTSELAEVSVTMPDSAEGIYTKATLSYQRIVGEQPGVTKQVVLSTEQLKSDLLIPSGTYNFSVVYEGKDKAGAVLVAKTIPGNKYCDTTKAEVKPARLNSLVLPVCEGTDIRDAPEFTNGDGDVAASVKVSSDVSYSGDKNVIECWRYGTKNSGNSYIGSFLVNSVKEGGYQVYMQVQTGNEDKWQYKFFKISKASLTKEGSYCDSQRIKVDAPAVSIFSSNASTCSSSTFPGTMNFWLDLNGERHSWQGCRVRNVL